MEVKWKQNKKRFGNFSYTAQKTKPYFRRKSTMKYLALSLLFMLSLTACTNGSKSTGKKSKNNLQTTEAVVNEEGFKTMKNLCYSCHGPDAEMEMRMAPPMIAVKMHYRKAYPKEDDFVNAIWGMVDNPDSNKALMKGAVRKFGLMPYLPHPEEDVKAIASYIYHNDLKKPEWFAEHMKKGHGKKFKGGMRKKQQKQKGARQKGKSIALATKKELGKNLMQAISEKGAAGAVEFCNVKAMPITIQKEKEHNAIIKRASDKPRNPANAANVREQEIIKNYKTALANNEGLEALIDKSPSGYDFYYPILTNDMCIKCHGKVGRDIQTDTYEAITSRYPEDRAVGYNVNEVRGIWHIQFQKE